MKVIVFYGTTGPIYRVILSVLADPEKGMLCPDFSITVLNNSVVVTLAHYPDVKALIEHVTAHGAEGCIRRIEVLN